MKGKASLPGEDNKGKTSKKRYYIYLRYEEAKKKMKLGAKENDQKEEASLQCYSLLNFNSVKMLLPPFPLFLSLYFAWPRS